MIIKALIWLPDIIDKLEIKHGVIVEEVEEAFEAGPMFRRGPRGKQPEKIYIKPMGKLRPDDICLSSSSINSIGEP